MVRFISLLLFTLTLTLTHAYPQYRYQQERSSFLSSLRSHTLIQLSSRHLPSAHTSALSSRFWSFSTSPFSTRKTYTPSSLVNDQPMQHITMEHPQYQHVEMTLDGMQVKMKLERNDDIFAPGYGETEQTYINGIRQDHLDITHEAERCHYRGTIENAAHDNHMIILHTCYQGYSGMMMLGEEMYLVEPAHRHMDTHSFNAHLETLAADVNPFSVHILARASDMITPDFVCGVGLEDATSFEQQAQHTFRTLSHAAQEGNLQHAIKHMMEDVKYKNQLKTFKTKAVNQKYVELLVVNDYTRINSATFGGDTKAVATSSAQIVSYMDGYYRKQGFTPAMAVVLVGQIFFKTADPYTVTFGNCATCGTNEVDVQQLLSLFNTWRSSPTNTKPYTAFDCGQLFSGLKFNGPILGYAGVRAMCKPVQSGGIAQMTNSDAFNALIGAHEMGHNLGMEHDTGSTIDCPETGYIMTAIVNFAQPPKEFSKCSKDYLTGYVNDAYSPQTCMDNTPTAIWGDASCGNGFVETGEDCDCGSSDCSRTANPCCNGATCRFHPNATCSETSACCKNCQLITAASKTICRTASTSCDVAEMCDGVYETCPPNYGLGAGTPCKEQGYPDGMCYGGTCSSHFRSCRETGSTFKGAPYDQCPQQASLNNNNFCGTMYCANNPSYCTFFHVAGQIAYIPDGVPCGDGQQCYHQQCVSSSTLNTQFTWKTTEWTSCTSCDEIQTRNVSCILITGKDPISGKATGTIASEYYCTPSARPSTSQSCINYEIGCTPQDESTANGDINVFGYKIEKNTVLFSSLGAVTFFFLILACCYLAITHGQIDEFIRPKYDQASPFNKT